MDTVISNEVETTATKARWLADYYHAAYQIHKDDTDQLRTRHSCNTVCIPPPCDKIGLESVERTRDKKKTARGAHLLVNVASIPPLKP